MKPKSRHLLRWAPIALAALFVLGRSTPAHAQYTCNQDLRLCYFRAAFADTWWEMWAMGMDCELNYADCTRRALIGR
jgi:hypothetical protein